ncbi:CBS domain-containing protein CBSX1, chloroplastic [Capsicum annuum]|nr:CBS domain-containing protein CBSX1, chloroplastic [Capsicum annuum]
MSSISLSGISLRRSSAAFHHQLPCLLLSHPSQNVATFTKCFLSLRLWNSRNHFSVTATNTLTANSAEPRNGIYTVGDFMTRKEDLHVVKPSTSVDEALEILVERRITGFPVVDDDWKLGLRSDAQQMLGMWLCLARGMDCVHLTLQTPLGENTLGLLLLLLLLVLGKKRVTRSGKRGRCHRVRGWLGLACGEATGEATLHDLKKVGSREFCVTGKGWWFGLAEGFGNENPMSSSFFSLLLVTWF